ncbi:MAG: 30S ribosomal protein S2 [Candidatus Aenigmatarchaeota archaeon]
MTDLVEKDEYLSAGAHIGMREKTAQMDDFIFKVRPDGLCVLDVEQTDERIEVAGKFLSRFDNIVVVSRKLNGQKPIEEFSEVIDAKAIAGRFLPGTLTNPAFPEYFDMDVIVITDPLADRQALLEAIKRRIPIIALCDTYNDLDFVDLIIPVNNKGRRSLALVYYLMAREILKNRGEIEEDEDFDYEIEDFQSSE